MMPGGADRGRASTGTAAARSWPWRSSSTRAARHRKDKPRRVDRVAVADQAGVADMVGPVICRHRMRGAAARSSFEARKWPRCYEHGSSGNARTGSCGRRPAMIPGRQLRDRPSTAGAISPRRHGPPPPAPVSAGAAAARYTTPPRARHNDETAARASDRAPGTSRTAASSDGAASVTREVHRPPVGEVRPAPSPGHGGERHQGCASAPRCFARLPGSSPSPLFFASAPASSGEDYQGRLEGCG